MNTITIPKRTFELLERRSKLYEKILRTLPERKWGIEEYSDERIRKFMKQDLIKKETQARLKKILSNV